MKIINKILTLGVIVLIVLLIFKDDYKNIFNKISSVLSGDVKGQITNLTNNSLVDNLANIDLGNLNNLFTNPGAMVKDSYLFGEIAGDSKYTLSNKNIIKVTNNYRTKEGLAPLKENTKLNLSAMNKVDDIFENQYFEHVSPSGVKIEDLANNVSYEYIIVGENLALGNFEGDEDLVLSWMNSKGHRENILNSKYKEIGVASKKGMFEGKEVWVSVQHFGLPRSVCPSISNVLKGTIELKEKEVKNLESDLYTRKSKIDSGVVYEGLGINSQISEYNSLVSDYNLLLKNLKEKILEYNNQIKEFNSCISNFQ